MKDEHFTKAQHLTIVELIRQNDELKEEVKHLKSLLTSSMPIVGEQKVEQIIVTPEEALLDSQINKIQNRGWAEELNLEDVKKLDLLLKNKKIFKTDANTIKAESKKIIPTNAQLLSILKKPDGT